MRTWAGIVVLLFLSLRTGEGGDYTIVWHSMLPAGQAAGGDYSLSGNVDPMAAAASATGGSHSVAGGFWSLITVTGSPLGITRNGDGTISIHWPAHLTGHSLEQSNDLSPASWAVTAYPVTDNGVTRSITLTPSPGSTFFRLVE